MSSKMSQKEYLKKYLSGGSDKKKKKKDKKLKSRATVKIIDDDLHASNNVDNDEELFLTGEDAPQIVGIVDTFGETAESKWKRIGDVKKEEDSDGDMWGKKAPTIGSTNQSPVRKRSPKAKFTSSSEKANNLAPTGISSDQSPPRKESGRKHHGNGSDSLSTNRSRDSVRSPERKSSSQSSKRSSEQSPPRRRQLSPRSRKDSDQSPPRKQTSTRLRRDSDQSPPRRQTTSRLRRDSDQSPPRRLTSPRSKTDSDQSPQRKRPAQRLRPNSDQSPERRRLRKNSDSSPQSRQSSTIRIKREKSNDQSPPRRRNNGNPFKSSVKIEKPSPDNSPQRYRSHPNSDKSPSRSRLEARSDSPPPSHKPKSKMTTTLDGKRAGLQDAKTLKSETEERRRNEDKMFSRMSKEVSGKDAEVQVRQNSSYRRRRKDIEEDPEVQRKKAEHEEKKKELYTRWNKGVKQLEAHEAKMSDDQYESSKPLARYSNDADLDEMLRQKEHQDDPMLEYMRNKKKDQQLAANIPVMPKYKGLYPENRYGIPPGYRWDGVDRSNGYEKKWFDAQSHKEALAEDAYKYSVEDM